ncbi:MAG: polysaccharide biosynthesis protein [Clostridia bacterium]|nr:polysaccharide biosynthesis protein [Clostridia bacterium]
MLKRFFRTASIVTCDILFIIAAMVFSAWILQTKFKPADFLIYFLVTVVSTVLVFSVTRIYDIVYISAGLSEGVRVMLACILQGIITLVISLSIFKVSLRFVLIFNIFFMLLCCTQRYVKRVYLTFKKMYLDRNEKKTRLMIVGGGMAGSLIIQELQSSKYVTMQPVCVIDDDPLKLRKLIHGVPIVGKTDEIADMAKKYEIETIIVAMPSISAKELKRVYEKCSLTGCKVQTLPGIYQLINEDISVSKLREVDIADLLGREQITVDSSVAEYIKDNVVLVTGGGGSIGSELCRQIAAQKPKQLIIFDIYENNAYEIEQELLRTHASLNLLTLIGSVRDAKKIDTVFETYRPDIVFNAAAHKHVPLMETSPNEAVKNNVFGTLNVARASDKHGVKRFVQISTDKAVNPTNVMGATKRICEMIIQSMAKKSKTEFVAVRFGNVLGSNGSVIPLFKKQIAEGGPVTVTHKDIIRYFMTIQEAVSLVLQAGAYAKGGEIFVLDMGEPVKIYDLAVNLIRLSGLEPNVDVDIVCTGLRPGEKLYEERLMAEEGLQKTANDMISIGRPLEIDDELLSRKLDELYQAAHEETDRMKLLVSELVPTYKIDNSNH